MTRQSSRDCPVHRSSRRCRRTIAPVTAALVLAVLVCGIAGPARAATTTTPGAPGDDILQLKDSLDASQKQQAQILADLDNLKARIDDVTVQVDQTQTHVAEAESAVLQGRGALSRRMMEMYRRPLSSWGPFLESKSVNEYVVASHYLSVTLNRDADAMAVYERAKFDQADLKADLVAQKQSLEGDVAKQRQLQQIVLRSIEAQQSMLTTLQTRLDAARVQGTLPWTVLPNCQVAPRTNLPGPYNLEDWAVFSLKSLAMRTQKTVTDVVTQQHVIALIAFAWGEGGGTNGHKGQFNPLNTNGWSKVFPDLAGQASGFGTDDWPTFDAGVEATARTLTSHHYTRLGNALVNPATTAADFFTALAHPESFAGNMNWSESDLANDPKYQSIQQSIAANYVKYGGTELHSSGQIVDGVPRAPTGFSAPGSLDSPMGC